MTHSTFAVYKGVCATVWYRNPYHTDIQPSVNWRCFQGNITVQYPACSSRTDKCYCHSLILWHSKLTSFGFDRLGLSAQRELCLCHPSHVNKDHPIIMCNVINITLMSVEILSPSPVHFHRRSRVGWRVIAVPSCMTGVCSHSLVTLHLPSSLVALVTHLWLTAQSQLSSWLPVGITARRVHAAHLDETCRRRNYMTLVTLSHVCKENCLWVRRELFVSLTRVSFKAGS